MKTGIYWQDPKYALKPGRGFIFDPSLVLYLPLHQLDGASFMSKDAYGHLCSVTGALWTPNGREFDGLDDVIKVPYHISYDIVTEFTATIWLKGSGVCFLGRDDVTNNERLWKLGGWGDILRGWISGITAETLSAPSSFDSKQWYFVGMAFKNATTRNLIVNGELVASDVPSGNVKQSSNLGISVGGRWDDPNEQFGGLFGEAWFYSRFLTPLEIQQNYLATKWRYQ